MEILKKRMQRTGSESGFTLIELLVVLVILGVLLAIAVPSYLGFRDRANIKASAANVRSALPAIEAYYSDNDSYTGISRARLVASYDQGIASTLIVTSATATTYCASSTVGGKTSSVSGPGGTIVEGTGTACS